MHDPNRRCIYCCRTHKWSVTAAACRKRTERRRERPEKGKMKDQPCHNFIGGFEIDPSRPSACQVCEHHKNAHRMPPCVCGHAWGDHAREAFIEPDVDDGKRPCIGTCDDCRCPNYTAAVTIERLSPNA